MVVCPPAGEATELPRHSNEDHHHQVEEDQSMMVQLGHYARRRVRILNIHMEICKKILGKLFVRYGYKLTYFRLLGSPFRLPISPLQLSDKSFISSLTTFMFYLHVHLMDSPLDTLVLPRGNECGLGLP
jgi:hypothetical protein